MRSDVGGRWGLAKYYRRIYGNTPTAGSNPAADLVSRGEEMSEADNEMQTEVIDIVKSGILLPPPPDVCQQCARDHEPGLPHDQQSLYWQYWFYKQHDGKWPTWRDAMAHCSSAMILAWTVELAKHGVTVEPQETQNDSEHSD
jgi:hypothetical protein